MNSKKGKVVKGDIGLLTKRVWQRTEMFCEHFCRARTAERLSIPASPLTDIKVSKGMGALGYKKVKKWS